MSAQLLITARISKAQSLADMSARISSTLVLALVLSLTIFFPLSQNATHLVQADWTPAHPTKEYAGLYGNTFYKSDLKKIETTLTESYTNSYSDHDDRKHGFHKRALSWEKAVERGEAALCFMDQTIPALTDIMRASGKLSYSGSDEDDGASSGDEMMGDGSGFDASVGSRHMRRGSDPGSIEAEPVTILVVTEDIQGDPHQEGGDEEMPYAPPK